MNIMLFLPDLEPEVVAAADLAQRQKEAQLRKSLESLSFSESQTMQAEGPLAIFLVPEGYKRVSISNDFPLWKEAMKDHRVARSADFPTLRKFLAESPEDIDDEGIPLDILGQVWRSQPWREKREQGE